MVCEAWALQGYGTPPGDLRGLRAQDRALRRRSGSCSAAASPGLGGLATIGDWWLSPIAFQKAILWSMLFEGLGLGCGSGPLTGRYFPPIGGVLYFLRPGTTKLRGVPAAAAARRRRGGPGSTSASTLALLVVAASRAGRAGARRRAARSDRRARAGARPRRPHDLPGAARRALLDDDRVLRRRRQLDRRRQGGAARALVLGRVLEAQPPLPQRGVRDDQQQPGPAVRAGCAGACTASYPDDLRPSRLAVAMATLGHRARARRADRPHAVAAGAVRWWSGSR